MCYVSVWYCVVNQGSAPKKHSRGIHSLVFVVCWALADHSLATSQTACYPEWGFPQSVKRRERSSGGATWKGTWARKQKTAHCSMTDDRNNSVSEPFGSAPANFPKTVYEQVGYEIRPRRSVSPSNGSTEYVLLQKTKLSLKSIWLRIKTAGRRDISGSFTSPFWAQNHVLMYSRMEFMVNSEDFHCRSVLSLVR